MCVDASSSFQSVRGEISPCAKMLDSQAVAATAASTIHVLSLQRHRHGLASRAPHDPCPAINAGRPVCRLLVRPYTTGPLSLS